MRIVTLEEHFTVPELSGQIDAEVIARRGWPRPGSPQATVMPQAELRDTGPTRIADMDASGITVQVLSLAGPGADLLDPQHGVMLAREFNERLGQIVREHPNRYAGFAHLPMTAPEAAADELERTIRERKFKGALINGLTEGRFLDHASFEPLLARAEALDVPIYIHPGVPPAAVRSAYYDGYNPQVSSMFATAGFGWHAETAIHVLRMVLSGTFDKHPRLKIIIGHMGEGLPTMLARCDDFLAQRVTGLPRSVSQTILDHVTITTSGFFTVPPFLAALLTFGADRILFSVDYPFSRNDIARKFLDDLPVSPDDKEKIAHGNADRLLKL